MNLFNLSDLGWTLVGTKPYHWKLWEQMNKMNIIHRDTPFLKAKVPGSIQQTLLDADLIPDWNIGTNYRECEWVENMHWIYETDIPNSYIESGKEFILKCHGLDDNGEVWLNGILIGEFNNTHLDHKFDLTSAIKPTNNHLAIVFRTPERYLGQIYWTSKTKFNKPRYYYEWDWCPRVVQIGICDQLFLEVSDRNKIEDFFVHTDYSVKSGKGSLKLKATYSGDTSEQMMHICLTNLDNSVIYDEKVEAKRLDNGFYIDDLEIAPWFPNGKGEQPLYKITCCLLSNSKEELHTVSRQIGFRKIEWSACEGAKPEADPWILSVNGTKVFMQGVNWTPIRTMFADVTENQYRQWLAKYKEMGANMLRVWGGATLERECFYTICDEMGLLVWQEFPISSSAFCNTPSDDKESVETMGAIVESYIRRRHHHPSLIAWSGGNELYVSDDSRPLDFSHPLLANVKRIVEDLDGGRQLMPTSPSGPTKFYDPALNGQGVQWDVHGPWWLPFEPSDDEMSNIRQYWELSDALFHSEAGVPGAASAALINKYRGKYPALPATMDNPIWSQFSWWIENDKFVGDKGREPESVEEYVTWSQQRQTQGLAIAVKAAKDRFPRCGGFLIWMGHDCYPCPVNTSVIDYDGEYKPVVEELKKIWK